MLHCIIPFLIKLDPHFLSCHMITADPYLLIILLSDPSSKELGAVCMALPLLLALQHPCEFH